MPRGSLVTALVFGTRLGGRTARLKKKVQGKKEKAKRWSTKKEKYSKLHLVKQQRDENSLSYV
jgi:hypothetical protein